MSARPLGAGCCSLRAMCGFGRGCAFARCSGNEWAADAVGPRGQRGKLDLETKGKRDPGKGKRDTRERDHGNKADRAASSEQ